MQCRNQNQQSSDTHISCFHFRLQPPTTRRYWRSSIRHEQQGASPPLTAFFISSLIRFSLFSFRFFISVRFKFVKVLFVFGIVALPASVLPFVAGVGYALAMHSRRLWRSSPRKRQALPLRGQGLDELVLPHFAEFCGHPPGLLSLRLAQKSSALVSTP